MSYLHDATPTWNGFNYQGKIALYVVLVKLLEIGKNSINEFTLELEWLEDFAIKENDQYLTIHQVKNCGANNLSDFKSAIASLLMKTLYIISNEELKSVITERKGVDKEALTNAIEHDLKAANIISAENVLQPSADLNSLGLSNEVIKYKDRLKSKLIQFQQITSNSNNLQKCYLHVAESINGNFDADSIKLLDTISPFSANFKYDEAVDKIELYQYSADTYNCNNTNIINLIENLIKRYLMEVRELSEENPACQPENLSRVRHYLLGLIDQNVSDRHQAIRDDQANTIENIPFTKFKEILDNDNHSSNNYYHAFHLKEAFEDTLNIALESQKDHEDICKLLLDLSDDIFMLYPKEKFIDFCLKIRPNVNDPKKMHTLHNEDGLRDSFFKFFSIYLKYDNAAFIKTPQNEYSLITTILEHDFNEEREKTVYKKIKENAKELPPLLFNVNTLVGNIGTGKGGKNYSDVIPKVTEASPDFIETPASSKFTISEDFKIVDLTDEIIKNNPPGND